MQETSLAAMRQQTAIPHMPDSPHILSLKNNMPHESDMGIHLSPTLYFFIKIIWEFGIQCRYSGILGDVQWASKNSIHKPF